MQIELRSLLRKLSFSAVCLISGGLYLHLGLRTYLASRLAAVPDPSNLRKAIRLEPSNAEYHDLLGRYLALSGQDQDGAIPAYATAVHLNPYAARYWLDLAGAYQVTGRTAETEETVEHALQADPTTPHVAWEAANFFLLQGSQEKALRQFRMVLANDRESADSALQLCWRATGDANQLLDQVLPRRPDLYLSFLRLLVDKQQTSAAEDVWNHLIALNQSFSPKLVFPYFRFLLEQHKVEAAQRAWQQLASLNPSLQAYLPSRENLIVNGGFEQDVLNGGFDWWYQPGPHATAVLDLTEFHSGRRSLSITFDGQNAADAGVLQFIPVKPNTEYEFSAEYKTKELVSASGPRFAIVDAYTNSAYFLGDDLLDTNPWRLQKTAFKTGQDTNLVLLKIIREPAGTLIRGKLWIDGLRLVEK
ncbi:MAG: hypothetical protein DMG72_12915 [Acidobacteria bacterium]|nr:MAG: hypothetical protein DMG72_12915 [Acidobacteriota bacterium]